MQNSELITVESFHTAEHTTRNFEKAVKEKGFIVFGRLDHAAAAQNSGLSMPFSTVVVFGNPKMGTPNFLQTPTLAIDLPLKALIWEDQLGKVWLSHYTSQHLYEVIYAHHGQHYTNEMITWLGSWYQDLVQQTCEL